MSNYNNRLSIAKEAIDSADYILLGGGSGLSAAAGLTYSGDRFTDHFGSFIEKYGFKDLYSSSFYPFQTEEERWAYWAKHISLNRYEVGATPLYQELFRLVQDKKYFVISTNVESQFVKAGFPSEKVFEIQGDYSYLQCEKACHNTLYYNESLVKEMLDQMIDCKIPSFLVPACPICGGTMDVNLRKNQFFVQDNNWYVSEASYLQFLNESDGRKAVFLELGVGYNTPGIIRYPFEKMTYSNQNATLIRINKHDLKGFKETEERTIAFSEDMRQVILSLQG